MIVPIVHVIFGSEPKALQWICSFSPSTADQFSGIFFKYTLATNRIGREIIVWINSYICSHCFSIVYAVKRSSNLPITSILADSPGMLHVYKPASSGTVSLMIRLFSLSLILYRPVKLGSFVTSVPFFSL